MADTSKATPRPWTQEGGLIIADRNNDTGGVICALSEPRHPTKIDGKTYYLAEYTPLRLSSPDAAEAYANGALIVQAVNAFDQLLEALEDAVELMAALSRDVNGMRMSVGLRDLLADYCTSPAWDAARAAIAQARGEVPDA